MSDQDWPPPQPPDTAPEPLRELWPLVLRYGISDDAVRENALDAASNEELTNLVTRVDKSVLIAITHYLDLVDNAEEACPYGDLAQAAMEAGIVLKGRLPSR
jgi:hypothetical protein